MVSDARESASERTTLPLNYKGRAKLRQSMAPHNESWSKTKFMVRSQSILMVHVGVKILKKMCKIRLKRICQDSTKSGFELKG